MSLRGSLIVHLRQSNFSKEEIASSPCTQASTLLLAMTVPYFAKSILCLLILICFLIKPSFAQENDTVIVHKVKDNIACLYGFKNENKEWVVQPKYTEASNFINGFSIIGDGLHYGVINEYGRIIIPVKYNEIKYLRSSKANSTYWRTEEQLDEQLAIPGYFRVRRDDAWGIVNDDHKIIIPIIYNSVQDFENGFGIIVSEANLYGFADTSGKIITPAYDEVYDFSFNNFAIVIKNKKWGLIDTSGKLIIPVIYDYIQYFNEDGLATVTNDKLFGLINKKGIILNAEYDDIDQSNPNYILFKIHGKYGIANGKGEYIVNPKYDSLSSLDHALAIYYMNGLSGLIDKTTGKILLKNKYQKFDALYKLNAIVIQKKDKYGLIDHTGKTLIAPEYDSYTIDNYLTEYIYFTKNKKVIAVSTKDYKGKPLKECLKFTGNIARLRSNWGIHSNGMVDKEGNVLLEPKYIIDDYDRIAIFRNESGQVGAINDSGNIIAPLGKYKSIEQFGSYLAIVKSYNRRLGIIDINGRVILDTIYYGFSNETTDENTYWVIPSAPEIDKNEDDSFNWCKVKYGLIDSNGHYILPPIYDFPITFENGLGIGSIEMNYGVINIKGETVLPFEYDNISGEQYYELFIVTKGDFSGIANNRGAIIAPIIYDEISGFQNGYSRIKHNGTEGLIDSSGKVILDPSYDSLNQIEIEKLNYPNFELENDIRKIDSNKFFYFKSLHCTSTNCYFDLLAQYKNKKVQQIVNNTILLSLVDYLKEEVDYIGEKPCLNKYKVYSLRGDYNTSNFDNNWTISNHIKLMDITDFSFSQMVETIEEHRRTNYMYKFKTFIIQNNQAHIITLDSLFDNTIEYDATLNSFIVQEIKKHDDLELDCTNPDKYIENLAEYFALSPDGLSFYIGNDTNEGTREFIKITIPYYKLKSFLRPNGVISHFIKKQSK